MTTRTRRVITAIDANGKAFSEIHRETLVGDKWYPDDPVPLEKGEVDAAAWKEEFNAAQQAENTQLKATIDDITAANSNLTQQLTEATATVVNLQAQVATIAGLQETIATQQQQLSTAASELVAMTTERDQWKSQVPPPPAPREVTPAALLMRVTSASPSALKKIWNSEQEIAAVVAATLFTYQGLIDLDSERLKELLGGLVQADLLTSDEMKKVLE